MLHNYHLLNSICNVLSLVNKKKSILTYNIFNFSFGIIIFKFFINYSYYYIWFNPFFLFLFLDYAVDIKTRKSTTGFVIAIGN